MILIFELKVVIFVLNFIIFLYEAFLSAQEFSEFALNFAKNFNIFSRQFDSQNFRILVFLHLYPYRNL